MSRAFWVGSLIMLVVVLIVAVALFAQQASDQKYKPSEVQELRLQLKQRDAQLAQRDLQAAQQRFQSALDALQGESEKIKAENGWPKDLRFDANTVTFLEPPKPAEKKP